MSTAANVTRAPSSSRQWRALLKEIIPPQREWTEEQYLAFTENTNWLIEFTDGFLEVLPMPTDRHQSILTLRCLIFRRVGRISRLGPPRQLALDRFQPSQLRLELL